MKLPETIRAAFVIARRDFTATVLSKTFLFFLLGPLFPILLGFAFGGIGAQVDKNAGPAAVAVIVSPQEFALLEAARTRLSPLADERPFVELRHVAPHGDLVTQRTRLLNSEANPVLGVLAPRQIDRGGGGGERPEPCDPRRRAGLPSTVQGFRS